MRALTVRSCRRLSRETARHGEVRTARGTRRAFATVLPMMGRTIVLPQDRAVLGAGPLASAEAGSVHIPWKLLRTPRAASCVEPYGHPSTARVRRDALPASKLTGSRVLRKHRFGRLEGAGSPRRAAQGMTPRVAAAGRRRSHAAGLRNGGVVDGRSAWAVRGRARESRRLRRLFCHHDRRHLTGRRERNPSPLRSPRKLRSSAANTHLSKSWGKPRRRRGAED